MKSRVRPPLSLAKCAVIALWLGLSSNSFTADVAKGEFGAAIPNAKTEEKKTAKRGTYPFSGTLESHDSSKIVLKGKKKNRTLIVTPETRVSRDGTKAKLEKASSGEQVSGSAKKNAQGEEEAVTIQLKGEKSVSK